MRVFIQSLDGEAKKWFRGLSLGSIVGIEAFDDAFLSHLGDKKYFCIILQSLGHLRGKKGNLFHIFPKGLIKCTIKSLQKSNLLKPFPK
jgi:hypothetical protein